MKYSIIDIDRILPSPEPLDVIENEELRNVSIYVVKETGSFRKTSTCMLLRFMH